MALQAILEKIRSWGEAQVQAIEMGVQYQANEILLQARAEAQQVEEEASSKSSAPAIRERARILQRAHLEALRIVGDVREDLVNTTITCMRERFASIRIEPAYPEVLRTLMEETLAGLNAGGTEKIQLEADPRDREILENILKCLKLEVCVSYKLNSWGGLIAKSEDGRVVVLNTFESRLERATPFLRSHLAAVFEEQQSVLRDVIHG